MKKNYIKLGDYVSPESTLLDVCFEGALCASTDPVSLQLEGYGIEDQFSW